MSMNGIDISSWQKDLNLKDVPCDFVIIKATEGTSYVNPYCDGFVSQAETLGKKAGVYHFASGLNAKEEAEYFVKNVKNYIGKAILALDWEIQTLADRTSWAKEWLDRVYQLTGVKPLIYMNNYTANAYNWKAVASAGYRLWNAYYYNYGTAMGYEPNAPLPESTGAFPSVVMYQYTSEGRLEGYEGDLDLNVFYGDAGDWDSFAKVGEEQKPEPEPEPPKPGRVIRYRIRFGDTLSGIAKRYRTTVSALTQLNGIKNPNRIFAGQVIKVPIGASKPDSSVYYTVKPGDTLSEIAERFGTSYQKLQRLNRISNPDLIYPGQQLRIR